MVRKVKKVFFSLFVFRFYCLFFLFICAIKRKLFTWHQTYKYIHTMMCDMAYSIYDSFYVGNCMRYVFVQKKKYEIFVLCIYVIIHLYLYFCVNIYMRKLFFVCNVIIEIEPYNNSLSVIPWNSKCSEAKNIS